MESDEGGREGDDEGEATNDGASTDICREDKGSKTAISDN